PCCPATHSPTFTYPTLSRSMPIINKPARGPFTSTERIIITIPVLLASLLHSINMSSAYVALPHIQGNLSATSDQVGWIVTSFVRSEEHTSELQSRENLVCRL